MSDTRTEILQRNYAAIRKYGFQGVRTDKVVTGMGLTKGALYHHFPTKWDVGYAVVDELLAPQYLRIWDAFAQAKTQHAAVLRETILGYLQVAPTDEQIQLGCPLTNLTQEMSPLDEGFRDRLRRITLGMQQRIETGLKNGQLAGTFRVDMNPTQVAFFILASIEGAFSKAKAMQSRAVFSMILHQLIEYTYRLEA
jgi:TetR/AcrR family transcriptional repressor of nem operon